MDEIDDSYLSDDEPKQKMAGKKRPRHSAGDEGVEGEEDYSIEMTASLQKEQEETAMEPFNLSSERDTGYFDDSGNYVWRRRNLGQEVTDAWLDEIDSETAVTANAAASAKRQRQEESKRETDTPESDKARKLRCLRVLDRLVLHGEDVIRALQRLGHRSGNRQRSVGTLNLGRTHRALEKKRTEAALASKPIDETPEQRAARQKDFSDLTEAADTLLSSGLVSAYQETRQSILANIRALEPPPPTPSGVMWEYKIRLDDDKVHGPYPAETMEAWRAQGFFSSERLAFCRRVAPTARPEHTTVSAVEELLADFDGDEDEGSPAGEQSGWERSDKADFLSPS